MVTIPLSLPEPRVEPAVYEVSCLPRHHQCASCFTITVRRIVPGRWLVTWQGRCLDAHGRWAHTPPAGSGDAGSGGAWPVLDLFDEHEALARARQAAPHLTCHGVTVAEALGQASAKGHS